MLPEMPGITRANDPTKPTITRRMQPTKVRFVRSLSARVGMKESENAVIKGIRKERVWIGLGFLSSFDVMEGIPPIARPTNRDTVGSGYLAKKNCNG